MEAPTVHGEPGPEPQPVLGQLGNPEEVSVSLAPLSKTWSKSVVCSPVLGLRNSVRAQQGNGRGLESSGTASLAAQSLSWDKQTVPRSREEIPYSDEKDTAAAAHDAGPKLRNTALRARSRTPNCTRRLWERQTPPQQREGHLGGHTCRNSPNHATTIGAFNRK